MPSCSTNTYCGATEKCTAACPIPGDPLACGGSFLCPERPSCKDSFCLGAGWLVHHNSDFSMIQLPFVVTRQQLPDTRFSCLTVRDIFWLPDCQQLPYMPPLFTEKDVLVLVKSSPFGRYKLFKNIDSKGKMLTFAGFPKGINEQFLNRTRLCAFVCVNRLK